VAELSDDLHARIEAHCAKGDALAEQGQFTEAITAYGAAWMLLPEPKTNWEAATWILTAIADAHFLSGNWRACRKVLQEAVKGSDNAVANAFLRLRLGQSLFELGEFQEAANWLTPAFLMEGRRLFENEDPKYLGFLKQQLEPPPDGWPEGW
jgi:tetratricopeptide (TPR) repeat protein